MRQTGGCQFMDDAQYVFNQTSSERKRIGRGAVARKNGSKSKKCGLPSDYLSAAEKRKLNGECVTYELSRPMSWQDFKGMPHDIQSEYIRKLAGMGAGRNDIADMFRITPDQYSQYMVRKHKGEKFLDTKVKNNDAFVEWFIGDDPKPAEEPAAEIKEEPAPAEPVAEAKTAPARAFLNSGSISYSGNAKDVFESILQLMDENSDYDITVSFSLSAFQNAVQNS